MEYCRFLQCQNKSPLYLLFGQFPVDLSISSEIYTHFVDDLAQKPVWFQVNVQRFENTEISPTLFRYQHLLSCRCFLSLAFCFTLYFVLFKL